MHPIERLRYVARASGGSVALVREAAHTLGAFTDDPPALVTACRRLVERHPSFGPMWWLAARVLCASDPDAETAACARALGRDPTADLLTDEFPSSATVAVIGYPEQALAALRRRGDLTVLAVDVDGEGKGLVHALDDAGVAAELVDAAGLGGAVRAADIVLLDALALGDGVLAAAGSLAAAAVGQRYGRAVWVVAGVGRALPARMWAALIDRVDGPRPWDLDDEVVPIDLLDAIATPIGRLVAGAAVPLDCPVAPELVRKRT